MNRQTVTALALALIVAVALAGCQKTRAVEDIRVPDAQPVLDGIKFTETTVMGSVADIRFGLKQAVEASKGLPSEPTVRAAAANVEATLTNVEAAIAAHPAADVEKLVAEFQLAIEQLREVIKQRDAEIQSLKDANARTWHWILYGGAVACTLAAVASGFFASSIPVIGPYLGPRIGVMFGALAGTLYVLGYLYDWTREHPVYTGVGVALIIGVALGLVWANKVDHDRSRRASATA